MAFDWGTEQALGTREANYARRRRENWEKLLVSRRCPSCLLAEVGKASVKEKYPTLGGLLELSRVRSFQQSAEILKLSPVSLLSP